DISELEKPDLTDRGMIGRVPMPPNCYWDADTQAWVEIGTGKAEGGDLAGGKAGNAGGEEKQSFLNKMKNVYNNFKPAGLAKNAALAAAPEGAKQASDIAKEKAGNTAKAAADLAKKAGKAAIDKTKKSADYLKEKAGDAAHKAAELGKKAGNAAKDMAKKVGETGIKVLDKTKKLVNNKLKNPQRRARDFWDGKNKFKKSMDYLRQTDIANRAKLIELAKFGVIDGTEYGAGTGAEVNIKITKLFKIKLGYSNMNTSRVEAGEIIRDNTEFIGADIQIGPLVIKKYTKDGVSKKEFSVKIKNMKLNKYDISIGGSMFDPRTGAGIKGKGHIHLDKLVKKIFISGRKEDE
ncbi:hypothetical protein K8S19_13670, partial [bacterium]|nr:hypothetical protein [bacterium]